jgi:hypothetical protein
MLASDLAVALDGMTANEPRDSINITISSLS